MSEKLRLFFPSSTGWVQGWISPLLCFSILHQRNNTTEKDASNGNQLFRRGHLQRQGQRLRPVLAASKSVLFFQDKLEEKMRWRGYIAPE